MLRQQLNGNDRYYKYDSTPRKDNLKNENDDSVLVSEWKLAAFGLVFSIFVLISKLYYANRDYLKQKFLEDQLYTYETITSEGEVMFRHGWKTAVRYSKFWLPILCGVLSTLFTWTMVFLDSSVPGVQPPSPFSPSKVKAKSGHTFHLNYVFAVLIGLAVSSYMYWKEVSIEF